jgi:hypothetical protein
MDYKKTKKTKKIYSCVLCDFNTSKKFDYEKHLQTIKHNDYTEKENDYFCICGKKYKYRQNLYRHKQTCREMITTRPNTNIAENAIKNEKKSKIFDCYECNETCMDLTEQLKYKENCDAKIHIAKNAISEKNVHFCKCGKFYQHYSSYYRHKKNCYQYKDMMSIVIKVLEKNEELLEKIDVIAKEPKIINNNNITNNTQFNIMNYLNNECKDAMNLSDFINELSFSLKDLEIMGTKGYQQSMEDTFIKQLTIMDKTKRPIHCSDKKRKSFYIKDDNIWEKDENNSKIVNGLKKISQKHIEILTSWTNYNKNWSHNERKQDFFNKSVQEVAKYNDSKQINKLISKLTKLSMK